MRYVTVKLLNTYAHNQRWAALPMFCCREKEILPENITQAAITFLTKSRRQNKLRSQKCECEVRQGLTRQLLSTLTPSLCILLFVNYWLTSQLKIHYCLEFLAVKSVNPQETTAWSGASIMQHLHFYWKITLHKIVDNFDHRVYHHVINWKYYPQICVKSQGTVIFHLARRGQMGFTFFKESLPWFSDIVCK